MLRWSLLLLIVSFDAVAVDLAGITSIDVTKLSPQDKSAVMQLVLSKEKPPADSPPAALGDSALSIENMDKIQDWALFGANIGKALAGTAREMGVAVNEFSSTYVGKIATFLIVWHFFGDQLLHILGSIFMIVVGFTFIKVYLDQVEPRPATYSKTEKNIFGNFAIEKRGDREISSDLSIAIFIAYVIVIIASVIMFITGG